MQLQRAMAAEAEAAREARAKVIAAEGEMRASRALKEASDVLSMSPAALQVRKKKINHFDWDYFGVGFEDWLISRLDFFEASD